MMCTTKFSYGNVTRRNLTKFYCVQNINLLTIRSTSTIQYSIRHIFTHGHASMSTYNITLLIVLDNDRIFQ